MFNELCQFPASEYMGLFIDAIRDSRPMSQIGKEQSIMPRYMCSNRKAWFNKPEGTCCVLLSGPPNRQASYRYALCAESTRKKHKVISSRGHEKVGQRPNVRDRKCWRRVNGSGCWRR